MENTALEIPVLLGLLKFVMVAVMLGGGIAVFRELIPMARGQQPVAPKTEAAKPEE